MPVETSLGLRRDVSGSGQEGAWAQWFLVAAVFIAAGVCLFGCAAIPRCEQLYKDMLGGMPLPPITRWILSYRMIPLFVALFGPLAALGTFAVRDRSQAHAILLGLLLLASSELLVLCGSLGLPFVAARHVISAISAGVTFQC